MVNCFSVKTVLTLPALLRLCCCCGPTLVLPPPNVVGAEHPDIDPVTLLLSSLPSKLTVSSAEESALLIVAGDFSAGPQSSFPVIKQTMF